MWIETSEQLPPPSAADPNRSDYYLLCHYFKVWDTKGPHPVESIYFSSLCGYYDFREEAWFNEYMADGELDDTTFWSPVPDINSPQWRQWNVAPPPGENPNSSIDVLVSLHGVPYAASITYGYSFIEDHTWLTIGPCTKQSDDGDIQVVRWMPIVYPDLPPLEPLPEQKGFFKKLFGK